MAAKTKKMSSPFPGERDEEGERERGRNGHFWRRRRKSPPKKQGGKEEKIAEKEAGMTFSLLPFLGPQDFFGAPKEDRSRKRRKGRVL